MWETALCFVSWTCLNLTRKAISSHVGSWILTHPKMNTHISRLKQTSLASELQIALQNQKII